MLKYSLEVIVNFQEKFVKISESVQPEDVAIVGGGLVSVLSVYFDIIEGFFGILALGATFTYTVLRIREILRSSSKN